MKVFLSFVLVFQTSLLAQAVSDSIAFFFTPDKAVVLVKEFGNQGRLQSLMNAFKVETNLVGSNQDNSIRVSCVRSVSEATCTFGFAPSAFTQFGDKTLEAAQSLQDLQLPEAGDFEATFESSRHHQFLLKIESGKLVMKARKPGA